MTLKELEDTLPNGFHDAQIGSIAVDFLTSSATLRLKILTSLPDTEEETGVLYREIAIQLEGLRGIHLTSFGSMKNYPNLNCWMKVQGFKPTEDSLSVPNMRGLDSDTFYGFFVHDWNDSIYLSAETATLIESWLLRM
ncbi:hypothetical protein RBB79_05485 [Tunturiibacter empetritectus]|uniref:Uncharacterized protein n=2 Tax=Tunturiibacter TaxID=3154218 RepID=A0A852VBZ2_9BACT|nr:hypothetical protein [Edaphobacter lichenicola]NYF88977.1 hypothetical protein [Edaphobacter lichenicola]